MPADRDLLGPTLLPKSRPRGGIRAADFVLSGEAAVSSCDYDSPGQRGGADHSGIVAQCGRDPT